MKMFSVLFFALHRSALALHCFSEELKLEMRKKNTEIFWLNLIALIFTLHYLGNILANSRAWCF